MKTIFDEVINRKGTYCTQWDYIEDRFGRKDLLPFSISDTDFLCPPEVLEALKGRIDHGIFGYTRWNHSDFKEAIQRWYQLRFKTNINLDSIVYSPSVTYTISRLISHLTEVEDHVVVQTPAYDAFFKVIEGIDRFISANKLLEVEGSYQIDFLDLDTRLSHPKAKILLLCSPHNPTGRVWTLDELTKIVNLCQKHHVFLISDEIHMDIVSQGNSHIPIFKVADDLNQVCICTSSSKTFNFPGLGGSYAMIPNSLLRDKFLFSLKNQDGLSSASALGVTSLISAYDFGGKWVDELNQYIDENMKTVKEFLEKNFPEIIFKIPESTYLAWINIKSLPYTSEEIQDAFINIGQIAIMPGETYGIDGEGYLRLNVGCPRSKLIEGLHGFKKALDYLAQTK